MNEKNQGIDVITIGTEALYPWNAFPVMASKLDRLAKENSVTIAGSGYIEISNQSTTFLPKPKLNVLYFSGSGTEKWFLLLKRLKLYLLKLIYNFGYFHL